MLYTIIWLLMEYSHTKSVFFTANYEALDSLIKQPKSLTEKFKDEFELNYPDKIFQDYVKQLNDLKTHDYVITYSKIRLVLDNNMKPKYIKNRIIIEDKNNSDLWSFSYKYDPIKQKWILIFLQNHTKFMNNQPHPRNE